MSLSTMVPEIWSSYILGGLEKEAVVLPLANPRILADASTGDVVHVNALPKLSASTYVNATGITYNAASSSDYSFNVNQMKYIAIKISDEEAKRAQTSAEDILARFTRATINGLVDAADGFLATQYSNFKALGSGASPKDATTGTKALSVLLEMKKEMDKASIPSMGRFVVVGPSFANLLLSGTTALSTMNQNILTTGVIGTVYGLEVRMSNNVGSNASADEIIFAGYEDSFGFAHNVSTVEVLRDQDNFGWLVRGLYVFGGRSLGHSSNDIRGVVAYCDTIA